MNPNLEARRIRELTAIVGADVVAKYAFYDNVEYDRLSVIVRIQTCGDRMSALKQIRQIVDTPASELLAALKKGNGESLHSVDLASVPGCMQKREAVRNAQRIQIAVANAGGSATIDFSLEREGFHRCACSEEEINYLATRLITWM